MGIINNMIKKAVDNYITKELDFTIDPSSIFLRDEKFRELENKLWYEAKDASEIRHFYKTNIPDSGVFDGNIFYRAVRGKTPVVHVPIPKLITNTVVNLVFNETPELTVDCGNQKRDEELNELILNTLDENDRNELFKKIGSCVSYSGSAGVKFVMDTDISDKVILQVYPKEDMKVKKKYNRVVEVRFLDYFDKGYHLESIYGKGFIHYELYNKENKLVDLNEVPEIADLENIDFIGSNGERINQLMCVYVENTSGDVSDYEGCIDSFQVLDELKSAMVHITRALKPKRGVPSGLCEIDRNTGKTVLPNEWDTEEILLEVEDPEQKIKNMSEVVFNAPELKSYQELFDKTFKDVLSVVSLSPSTIGENDGGSNSSSLALNIREKSSLRKRAALITKFDKAFQELSKLIILYNNTEWNNEVSYVDETPLDYDYFTDFSEYAEPDFDGMIRTLASARMAGLISQREALKELYGDDMSDEDIEVMMAEINGEEETQINESNKDNPVQQELNKEEKEKDEE